MGDYWDPYSLLCEDSHIPVNFQIDSEKMDFLNQNISDSELKMFESSSSDTEPSQEEINDNSQTETNLRNQQRQARDLVLNNDEDEEEEEEDEEGAEMDYSQWCCGRNIEGQQWICCENRKCKRSWFHFDCVGLTEEPIGKWYCPNCLEKMRKNIQKNLKNMEFGFNYHSNIWENILNENNEIIEGTNCPLPLWYALILSKSQTAKLVKPPIKSFLKLLRGTSVNIIEKEKEKEKEKGNGKEIEIEEQKEIEIEFENDEKEKDKVNIKKTKSPTKKTNKSSAKSSGSSAPFIYQIASEIASKCKIKELQKNLISELVNNLQIMVSLVHQTLLKFDDNFESNSPIKRTRKTPKEPEEIQFIRSKNIKTVQKIPKIINSQNNQIFDQMSCLESLFFQLICLNEKKTQGWFQKKIQQRLKTNKNN
ncbi:chromatin modification-related protein yng2 [Anaeramoeba flamelloides]|uniref:Chromatin modification-related protein yng2 n=1 Tax=Anaeramoeba flamelloides TaxID=1746091 RepID=A0AAV7ZCK1_9EUKA|nr:chromatin modification-related protein yng2 [Anaeramoeba flamelloides]